MLRSGGAEPGELVAVVDLGSTAVRLLVARVTPDSGYRVLAEERVPTRLGSGAPGTCPARRSTRHCGPCIAFHAVLSEWSRSAHRRGSDVGRLVVPYKCVPPDVHHQQR